MSIFLKEGKTNWKYILILLILTTTVVGGISAYQHWWLPREEGRDIPKE